MNYHSNLIQINVRNKSIIYCLDHPSAQEEVNFLSYTGQFVSPDTYVNTGFTNAVSFDNEDDFETFIHHTILVTNELNTLCFKEDQSLCENKVKYTISGMLFRTYTEIDLFELKHINKALQTRTKLSNIDLVTILSTFDGHSIFSIYYEDVAVYE